MSNILVASIYIPFAILTALILLQVFLRNSTRQRGNYMFMFLCLLVICWYTSNIAETLTTNENTARFLWSFFLVFVGFIPPILLLFVLDFYRLTSDRITKLIPLMFIIPTINVIVALTSGFHTLIYRKLYIVSLSPIHEVVREWGPWFWVHTIHCYILSVIIISVILIRHFHMPKFYRFPSFMMAIGITITLMGNVVTLFKILPPTFDPTIIGTSLALIFFNFAIINNDSSKFVRYSFGKVFDYLDLYVLVMDENNRMVYVNRPARKWLSSLGITIGFHNLNEIIEILTQKGAAQKEPENEKGIDFYFPTEPLPVVLNMHVQDMADTNGDNIGSIVIFADVTQNRLLLSRLEEKAGIDSLTGIANRMAYEGAKKRLNLPQHLPLSVIMCDINGLKIVNDSLGHHYGDMMLQVASEVLEEACPKQSFLARIGGDEFVYLLPRTCEKDASALMDKITAMLSGRENLPFTLSVALGAATKQSMDEKLSDIVDLADSRMYENKRRIKSQQQ